MAAFSCLGHKWGTGEEGDYQYVQFGVVSAVVRCWSKMWVIRRIGKGIVVLGLGRWLGELSIRERWFGAIALLSIGTLAGFATADNLSAGDMNWAAVSAIATIVGALLSGVTATVAAWVAWKSYQSSVRSSQIAEMALNADRAWLFTDKHEALYSTNTESLLPDFEPKIVFSILIKNHGLSPATNVRVTTTTDFGEWKPTGIFAPSGKPVARQLSVIVPGGSEKVEVAIFASAAKGVYDEGRTWNLALDVEFDDIFSSQGQARRRHARQFSISALNFMDIHTVVVLDKSQSQIG
jgi:hypothetical protein